ncbi:MAG: hypothetical protein KJ884_09875, partial [Gammaproteobacteria bacterium]|nr:hypothetical protein [Gammaproteobacteria bacterium]
AFEAFSATRQREANSTAFQTAVNHLFYRFNSTSTNLPTTLKPPPRQPGAFYTAFAALQPLFLS